MIAIASDHAAFNFKTKIIEHLTRNNIEFVDCGSFDNTVSVDYPDFATVVCDNIISGKCNLGILICGTGIGMSMAANKVRGIRAAVCGDVFSAKATRLHNDANILCMGERVLGLGLALEIVDAFVSTPFSNEERHSRRIAKIATIEHKHGK